MTRFEQVWDESQPDVAGSAGEEEVHGRRISTGGRGAPAVLRQAEESRDGRPTGPGYCDLGD